MNCNRNPNVNSDNREKTEDYHKGVRNKVRNCAQKWTQKDTKKSALQHSLAPQSTKDTK